MDDPCDADRVRSLPERSDRRIERSRALQTDLEALQARSTALVLYTQRLRREAQELHDYITHLLTHPEAPPSVLPAPIRERRQWRS